MLGLRTYAVLFRDNIQGKRVSFSSVAAACNFFTKELILERHKLSCNEREPVRVVMPDDNKEGDKWVKFKNVKHTMRVPYVIYADFECLTVPIDSCQPNSRKSYTEAYQKHEPISFCYYIASTTGIFKAPFVYRGPNAPQVFMERIKEEALEIQRLYRKPLPMDPLTKDELEVFEKATHCYMCENIFTEKNKKVNIIFLQRYKLVFLI